ncbi:hypothetical protein EV643_106193 [Kribbella sp. VKM Ac-2527]|uniref:Uncharacterized protein n=1 Tax=Kribbella caucasensis TaxID=2512215 RepID=A0A4R6KK09_9ACTN|nr:hypothetical protein [Kribbella sp. VKM Ac-2527]TDO49224.1 hypothetical protein EV643_106193 [Kribbella sp. VKM Ac-2527]
MSLPPRRRVRLWFGEYQLADYIGEPASAARHEAALRRRFPGLEVTNLPLGEPTELRAGQLAPIPLPRDRSGA